MKREQNFKETEIGKIPKDWDVRRIESLASINESTIKKTYPHAEINYFDTSSVEKGQILGGEKLSLNEAPSRAKRIVKDNDILISTVRPNLKHFAFIKRAESNMVASTGFAVITAKKIIPEFLYYYLSTDRFTDYLTAIADTHTSTYPSFNPNIIENSYIPFPSDDEQKSIAKILTDLDLKIELNHQMNKILEAIGQAIFKHWFIDFEFPKHEEVTFINGFPEEWNMQRVGDILELAYGKALKEDIRQPGNVAVYGSNGQIGWHNKKLVTGPGIVVGRKGNPGIVTWVPNDFFPIDTCFYVNLKRAGISIYYLLHALQDINLPTLGADSAVPGLNRNIAYNTELLVPSPKIVKQFDELVKPLFDLMFRDDQEIIKLSAIRNSILPKLMSGNIRVNGG